MVQRERHVNSMVSGGGTGSVAAGRAPRRAPNPHQIGLLLSLATTVVVLGLGAIAWEAHYGNRVIPGVWVAGIPLQGLTASEAEEALREGWSTVGPRHLTLRDGDRQWVLPLEELGIHWDLAATMRTAMAVGRSGSFAQDWLQRLRSMRRSVVLPAQWSFDEGQANLALLRLAQEIDQPARPATLTIAGIVPQSEPAATGRELDVAASREQLRQALANGLPQTMDLVVRVTQPAVVDGEKARERAESLLSRQITVTFREGDSQRAWALGREVIAQALSPRQEAGADGLAHWTIDIKPDPLAEWVTAIAAEIDRPLIEGRARVDPATMQATLSLPGQSGREVDTAEAVQRLLAALEGNADTVELPVEITPPYVTPEAVASWGKLTLLSEGVSYFAGSAAPREHNIVVGTSRYPGVVVPPGATFSFNQYLGPITAAEGWAEAWVIMGDRTELGAGGGICQVATTAFRAAFYGGFPIVERYEHTYRVTTYEPPIGLDAAVFTPSVDLRFTNDLDFPIIIESSADTVRGKLSFRFYGPGELGRTVELEGPYVDNVVKAPPPIYEEDPSLAPGQVVAVDSAHDGARATVYRIIKQNGQVIAREPFVSNYQAWPARYKVGPRQ
jgi:vancomycin resistance protein YoaR